MKTRIQDAKYRREQSHPDVALKAPQFQLTEEERKLLSPSVIEKWDSLFGITQFLLDNLHAVGEGLYVASRTSPEALALALNEAIRCHRNGWMFVELTDEEARTFDQPN